MRRACLALFIALAAAAPAAQEASPQAAEVAAVRSVERAFSRRLVLRGRTEADRRVDVRAEIEGLVASAPLRKGADVAAGDVLCRIAPGERPALLAEAQANLARMQLEYDAAVRLRERGFTAETESLTRAAGLETAKAMLDRAEIAMGRLTLTAPFAGVLETDAAETGALLQQGSVCATVIALDPVVAVGYAAERDVDRIAVGASAQVRLVNGMRLGGDVRFVARAADPDTRTYRVEVEIANPDRAVRDGMTAEITLGLAPTPAHYLPQSALTLDDAGRLGVRMAVDGVARFAPIDIIADDAEGVWVAGPPAQADVIVVGQEFVSDGQPVTATVGAAPTPAGAAAGAGAGADG